SDTCSVSDEVVCQCCRVLPCPCQGEFCTNFCARSFYCSTRFRSSSLNRFFSDFGGGALSGGVQHACLRHAEERQIRGVQPDATGLIPSLSAVAGRIRAGTGAGCSRRTTQGARV